MVSVEIKDQEVEEDKKKGLDLKTQDSSKRSQVKVDYVIVFSLKPLNREKVEDKAKYTNQLKEEYTNLLSRLHEVGLSAIGRPGAKGSDELLILVTALDESRISKEVENERMLDWLNGISCVKPQSHSDPPTSQASQASYRPSDRLRHLYNIITQESNPSSSESPLSPQLHRSLSGPGAGINPGQAPFAHVKSIFPPHDLEFNHQWISKWSDRSHFSIKIPQIELDQIKDIYGEGIGYYFAFLNFYFQALILPSIMGFVIWSFGIKLSITYSISLILWSLVFVEAWMMKERLLAIRWNSLACYKVEKRRIQFKPEKVVKNVITNELVGYFPWWKREARKFMTVPVLIVFAICLVTIITGITAIELIVGEVYNGPFKKVLSLLPTVLFAACVPQLVSLWKSVAIRLVTWENHTYESAYDRSLTIKMFIVHALVAYASLILTAFVYVPFGSLLIPHLATFTHKMIKHESVPVEEKAVRYLNKQTLNWSTYSIDNQRLYQQLFAYIFTNQVVNSFTEIGLPYLIKIVSFKYQKLIEERQNQKGSDGGISKKDSRMVPDLEDEKELLERLREEAGLPEYQLFVEYAEMAIQFGYVVLWTWPIAPFACFINNFFELRTDAIKLTKQSRRPIPTRTDSIGPWLDVLSSLTWFGAVMNTALVYLFQPTQAINASSVLNPRSETNSTMNPTFTNQTLSNQTMFTNLLEATIIKSKLTHHQITQTSNQDLFQSLLSILISSLIPILVSEHLFLFSKVLIKKIINRLMWLDSEAFILKRKSEWDLKESFLNRFSSSDWSLILNDSSTNKDHQPIRQKEKIEEGLSHEVFWSRNDLGLEEINRLAKAD
ncbi:calcium-activated chloride channel-domain-containing protein [Melampsora americana]|nr:calcium-activated chloride channel-domain-containing protein [Melampsora americana]